MTCKGRRTIKKNTNKQLTEVELPQKPCSKVIENSSASLYGKGRFFFSNIDITLADLVIRIPVQLFPH